MIKRGRGRTLVVLVEPADYTRNRVRRIYASRGITASYMHAGSEASDICQDADSLIESTWAWAWRAVRKYDSFVINGWTQPKILKLVLLNFLYRKPMAFESDTELSIPQNPVKRLIKWLWLRALFGRPWCYGFPAGRYDHEKVFLHYGMSSRRIYMMPMVTEESTGHVHPEALNRRFRFGFVGRLIPLKQVDGMIRALAALVKGGVNSELVIVGDGPERYRLETMSEGLPVTFKGALYGEIKNREIACMDVLILNSTHDQWGYVVNEALTSGVPVIVGDGVGARHELVESHDGYGETGLIVRRDDEADLVYAMRRISTESDLWLRLHRNALERMAYWNFDLYAKKFDAWLEVIGDRGTFYGRDC